VDNGIIESGENFHGALIAYSSHISHKFVKDKTTQSVPGILRHLFI
jgi:hypothetical protein